MGVDEVVLINIGDDGLYIKGVIDKNIYQSNLEYDKKYFVKEGYQTHFLITKSPKKYKLVLPSNIQWNLQYSIPSMTSLDATQLHPLFDSSRSLLDILSIQITEERKSSLSSDLRLCTSLLEKTRFRNLFSVEIPLRAIPKELFSDIKTPLLHASITIVIQKTRAPLLSSRILAVFPKELRPSDSGSVYFVPGVNCTQVGGKSSCLFEIETITLPFSYYSFYVCPSAIFAYFAIIVPQPFTCLEEYVIPSTIEKSIQLFEKAPTTRAIAYDLCSLVSYAANTPISQHTLAAGISTPIIGVRVMAEQPDMRLLESCSIQYHHPVQYPQWDQDTIADNVLKLHKLHLVSIIPDYETSIEECMKTFQSFGGTLILQPADTSPTIPVVIKPSDRILTLCHEGWNRSQILYQCLQSIQRCFPSNETPLSCHGAVSGFDPNKLFLDFTEEEKYQYLHSQFRDTELTVQAFMQAFHTPKVRRIGDSLGHDLPLNWGDADASLVTANRQYLYNYFSQVVWSVSENGWPFLQGEKSSRILIFCFGKSFSIALQRLIENCVYEEGCFNQVILVGLPYPDPISQVDCQSLPALENAYRVCFHSYISSFLYAEIPGESQVVRSVEESAKIRIEMISPEYCYTHYNNQWYIARIVQGCQSYRQQLHRYVRHVADRLSSIGWPSQIQLACTLSNQLVQNHQVDLMLYGPICKEALHPLDLGTLSSVSSILKELSYALTAYHDAGVIFNNLFYDNVFLYRNHICLFDIIHATVDPFPNTHVIREALHPLMHVTGSVKMGDFPTHTLDHYFESNSIGNDSFLLGVLWWIVEPSKRAFVEQKLLCKVENRQLCNSILSEI